MKKLLRLVLLLTFTSAAAIFLARQIGLQRPNPSILTKVFTNADGTPCNMPCAFGIEVGKTSFDDAILLLGQHPLTPGRGNLKPTEHDGTHYFIENPCVYISLLPDESNHVRDIVIAWLPNKNRLPCPLDLSSETLAITISMLGEPDKCYHE
jgi:hypothetical protein